MHVVRRWAHELESKHFVFAVPGGEVVKHASQCVFELPRRVLRPEKELQHLPQMFFGTRH